VHLGRRADLLVTARENPPWAGYSTFIAFVLLLTVAPGPDFAVVMKNALAAGRTAGLWTTVGINISNAAQGTVAALGLGAVIVASRPLFETIRWPVSPTCAGSASTPCGRRGRRPVRADQYEKGAHNGTAIGSAGGLETSGASLRFNPVEVELHRPCDRLVQQATDACALTRRGRKGYAPLAPGVLAALARARRRDGTGLTE